METNVTDLWRIVESLQVELNSMRTELDSMGTDMDSLWLIIGAILVVCKSF